MIETLKTVHVLPSNATLEFHQSLYLDREAMTLIPDRVFVNERGDYLFETNSLGLRGPEPSPGQRIAVVWGDSVVFSMVGQGWPELINNDALDCLFLNGGVEGATYLQIIKRALAINRRRPATLNLLMLGWTPYPGNRYVCDDLEDALAELPNPVLVTQPTCLNPALAQCDLRATFCSDADDLRHFGFLGASTYSVPLQQALFDHIFERNTMVRAVARKTGTPLIDLYACLDTNSLRDFRRNFLDISHPRVAAYPLIAKLVRESVRPFL